MAVRIGDHIGAIDAGSNAIRFAIFKLDEQLNPIRIFQKRYPVRLGAGTFATGALAETDMNAAIEAFREMASIASDHNVVALPAVATSAIRDASNAATLVSRIEAETGVNLRVITGSEEAELAAAGVSSSVADARNRTIIDVGGGSTEVIECNTPGEIISNLSLPLGAVRLAQQAGMPPKYHEEQIDQIKHRILEELFKLEGKPTDVLKVIETLKEPDFASTRQKTYGILIGGTARALARFAVEQKIRDPAHELAVTDLLSCQEILARTNFSDMPGMGIDSSRAGIILPGTLVLIGVMAYFRIATASINDAGVREGLAIKWLAQQA